MSTPIQITFDASPKQAEVCALWIDNSTMDIVYGGAKYSGKSWLGCSLIGADALIYPDTRYFIARAELKDLRGSTTITFHKVFNAWGLRKDIDYWFNGQDNFWEFPNGSRIQYLQAKFEPQDPDYARFGSMEFTRGWIEEAGDRIEEAAKNNLLATTGRHNNVKYGLKKKLLQTANPSKNYLYREYYQKAKNNILEPHKAFIQALPQDNVHGDASYIESLHLTLSYNQKQRLLFGNWDFDDDPTVLCDYAAIMDAFTNEHVLSGGAKKISADLAMQGRDRFVAGVWDGGRVTVTIDKPKATGKEIEQDLQKLMIQHSVGRSNVVADSDGMGSYLESYLTGIIEFHGNGKATDIAYANIKAECAYKLAEKINKREIHITCAPEQKQRIMSELGALKAKDIDADETRKRIVKKDDMKEQLGYSPDYLDMLIMGQVFDVMPKLPQSFVSRG